MNMKKLLALLLALVMVLALAACGSSDAGNDSDDDDEKTTTASKEDDKDPSGDQEDDPAEDEPVEDEPVEDEPVEDEPIDRPMPGTPEVLSAVADFVEENGEDLRVAFEESITSSGMTCTSTIEAIGSGFVITICVNELDDVDEETKAAMQETYDAMAELLAESLTELQTEVPELTYYCVNYCDVDGDFLANLYIGE